ncbi:MAG: hypothetical protein A2Y33_14280 [Spirochaetes bacterium GWF1_51_8]|nr:MAG: hypothetical protein A2Y33_14280 [Spirochaetes bacterium GWF1_51_8]
MKKLLFALLVIGLAKTGLFSAVLKIHVFDNKNQPVHNAAVSIVELNRLFNTSDGPEITVEVTNGVYTLIAAAEGYYKKKQSVAVNGDRTIDIVITGGTYNLGEITVFGKANKGEAISKTKVSEGQIKEVTQGFVNDVVKTLQMMPGVATSGSTFDSRMYIQGGTFWETISSFDNIIVITPFRWGGRISIFNPNWVNEIELYTAAFPSIYGQGLSGVIDVKSKDGKTNAIGGLFDLSAATMEFMLEGPLGPNDTFLINLRRTFYDFIANGGQAGVQYPYFWDGLLKYSHMFNPNEKLSFDVFGSAEGMKVTLSASDVDPNMAGGNFEYLTYILIASCNYYSKSELGDELILTGGFTYNRQDLNYNQDIATQFKILGDQYSGQLGLNYYINSLERNRIKLGFVTIGYKARLESDIDQYVLDYAMNWTNIANVHNVNDNIYILYSSAYAMDGIELFDNFIIQAGVRGEVFKAYIADGQETGWMYNINPLVGLKLEFTKYWDVFVRASKANQFPFNVNNLLFNYNIKDERNYQAIAGIDFENKELCFRLEGFYKSYNNIVEQDIASQLNNNGLREAFGFDVYLQKKAEPNGWFNGWVSYTYINAIEKITNRSPETLAQQYKSPLDEWFVPDYVRNHTASAIVEFTYRTNDTTPGLNFMKDWKISLDVRVMSGKPYTPATNFSQLAITNGTDVYQKFLLYYGKFNSEWTAPQINISLKISFPYSLFSLLELFGVKNFETSSYFSFGNLLNWENVVDYSYTVKDGALQKVAIKDLGFTFLGGMQIKF